ncbi:hypothetical protein HMPREF9123_0006 [Neisseria bacilliformis ATCC BAA-1200]|uniref:Uncharacterized protein n=1 Tax=Neisseria bacilliformis ATCC BAA-1200 TaxID=888742 RepID=F2B8F3_9NEIS|nr:hypothetical protein HMPREF9123_0006 [Neisseria bacilliformis ATCC BAA-1200]
MFSAINLLFSINLHNSPNYPFGFAVGLRAGRVNFWLIPFSKQATPNA